MKIIMTGGGTGGHVYPAIAIADKIKRKHPDAEILFVGTEKGMEKDIVPTNGYPIEFVTVSGFNRKNLLKNVKTMQDLLKGDKEARVILKKFKPDLVIGTGGYVCGPVVRAAHKMGIRTFIHEQNALPGMTNKMLEKYVEKVFVSFPDAKKYFKKDKKIVVTGNPIRRNFILAGVENYREKLGIGENDFVVLCFGGSRGAGVINKTMVEAIEEMSQTEGLKLFFITGKPYYEVIKEEVMSRNISLEHNIKILPYAENMHEYLLASDLVISRAGALTISEITACGKASILIPSPNVTGNHQFFNAKVVADKGGAIILEEKELTSEKLFSAIMKLKSNKTLLNTMSESSSRMGRIDAADVIYENLNI